MDSSTPVAARPVRNRANKTPVTTRSANADARRISLLAGAPARDVWTIALTALGSLDVLHPNWSLGIQVRRNGCVIRIPAIAVCRSPSVYLSSYYWDRIESAVDGGCGLVYLDELVLF